MDRRHFLATILKAFAALMTAIAAAAVVFVYPTRVREKRTVFLPVLDEDELPKRGVRKVEFSYIVDEREIVNRAFLVVNEGVLTAFSPVCTHLGCYVNWDNHRNEFLCPCHGGRYRVDGTVIAGPPPKPLNRLPHRIEAGKVLVGIAV